MDTGFAITPGLEALAKADPAIARGLELAGVPAPRILESGFSTLVRIIIDQQVSVASGRAIWKRVEEGLSGEVTPEKAVAAGIDVLKAFGLSKPKARYVGCLSEAILSGSLDLEGLGKLTDEQVQTELTAITGIGRWTAEVYIMFALGRPDILPIGDVALQEAARRLLGLETRPTAEELEIIGERWKPWRSDVAIFLWHYYKRIPAS